MENSSQEPRISCILTQQKFSRTIGVLHKLREWRMKTLKRLGYAALMGTKTQNNRMAYINARVRVCLRLGCVI